MTDFQIGHSYQYDKSEFEQQKAPPGGGAFH